MKLYTYYFTFCFCEFIINISICLCVWGHVGVCTYVWEPEKDIRSLPLPLYCIPMRQSLQPLNLIMFDTLCKWYRSESCLICPSLEGFFPLGHWPTRKPVTGSSLFSKSDLAPCFIWPTFSLCFDVFVGSGSLPPLSSSLYRSTHVLFTTCPWCHLNLCQWRQQI